MIDQEPLLIQASRMGDYAKPRRVTIGRPNGNGMNAEESRAVADVAAEMVASEKSREITVRALLDGATCYSRVGAGCSHERLSRLPPDVHCMLRQVISEPFPRDS